MPYSNRLQGCGSALTRAKIMFLMGAVLAGCGARSELWVDETEMDLPDASPDGSIGVDAGPPPKLGTQITAGAGDFTCGLLDGVAKCWGYNVRGNLGDGTTDDKKFPTLVGKISEVSAISPSHSHVCALVTDRSVYCWGSNELGEVGDGTGCSPQHDCPDGIKPTPIEILGDGQVLSPSGPAYHTCAQRADGSVVCWGNNGFGQFCNSFDKTNEFTPVPVPALYGAIEVRTGYSVTCARWSTDSVQCCGSNEFGQLGDGTTTNHAVPVPVEGLSGVTQLAVGQAHVCAVLLDGGVKCWGSNTFGQLGDGTTDDRHVPVQVGGISDAVGVSVGLWHSCVWLTDGTAWCWGKNEAGQLGDSTKVDRMAPVQVANLSDVVEMAVGIFHTCARRTNGDMLCWGRNAHGELGDGTTEQRLVPTPVAW